MAYTATSPDSMLLRYLYLKGLTVGEDQFSIDGIAAELAHLQQEHPDIRLYETDDDIRSIREMVSDDLRLLEGIGFVRCDFSNPHVRLTEWGRFFASLLELPSNVREALAAPVAK